MEAYIGAVALESEAEGIKFAKGIVRAMFTLDTQEESINIQSLSLHEPSQEPSSALPNEPSPSPGIATGQLHDLASRHGIQLDWQDQVEGPKHAQSWTSDITRESVFSWRRAESRGRHPVPACSSLRTFLFLNFLPLGLGALV